MRQRTPSEERVATWAFIALVAVMYFAAARLGLLLATVHGNVSPVWPATGVALAAVLLGGTRLWPGIALGAFAANALTPVPLLVAACIAVGNTLEALAGAWIVRRATAALRRFELETLADSMALAVASIVAPAVSATCGVLALYAGGAAEGAAPTALWRTWWVGDALGALMLAPLLLALAEAVPRWRDLRGPYIAKAVTVFGAALSVSWLVFFEAAGGRFLFGIFPVMLLAAAWLGSCGVKLSALLISGLGIAAAYLGSGPFAGGSVNEDLLHLQLFLTSVASAALVLPAFHAARSLAVAGGVLLVTWLISGWLFASLQQDRLRADASRFSMLTTEAENSVRQRLAAHEDALRGGAGLLSAAKHVSRAEWGAFAQSLRLTERYPGAHGIGVIFPVPKEQEAAFLRRVRADGAPDFQISEVTLDTTTPLRRSPSERFVTTYVEPIAPNRAAIGLDIASETNRRNAAEIARDTGEPQITGRITLVQDDQRRAGFLLLMPIYRSDLPVQTIAQRRDALVAWIYSPFVTERFLDSVLGSRRGELRVQCFLGRGTAPADRVYSSQRPATDTSSFERVAHLALAGQIFTLAWNRGEQFMAAGQSAAVWAGTSMALISLLIAGLVMSLHAVGRQARAIAARQTAELAATGERLMALNARLEEKNAEFRDFAHTASHDLREPLRAMQGFSAVLLDDYGATLPPDAQDMLRRIHGSANRMAALIQNLLAYAEADSGAQRIEHVDLAEVIKIVEHDLHSRIASAGGRIECATTLPAVSGDPTQLRQLFQNLIGNSLKFHRPGVPPVVTIQAELLSTGTTSRQVRITLQDNGIGFDARHAEQIFRPFHRLHGGSKFEGSGIGLAICRRVVERHGGAIHASAQPGEGARFTFTLPLGTVSAPAPANALTHEPQSSATR